MEHDVFISYSSKDKQIADAMCHVLEQHKISCWIAPRDVLPGDPYARAIIQGIKNCKIMVLVFSEHANASEHVGNEIDSAFNHGKTIIPFLVDNTPMNEEFNYYLKRKHWLIAYPNYEEKFLSLTETIAGILNIDLNRNISKNIQVIKIRTDDTCTLYIDGEKRQILEAEQLYKIPLEPGTYWVECIGCQNPKAKYSFTCEVGPDIPKNLFLIDLKSSQEVDKHKIFCSEQIIHLPPAQVKEILEDPRLLRLDLPLCYVEGGIFTMGDIWGDGFEDELPLHEVTLSDFFIGKYPVTQKLWTEIMSANPSHFIGDDHPVEQVSWYDAQEFIRRLGQRTGYRFSLPTEAQWEFAARGGTRSKGYKYSGSDDIDLIAWHGGNEKEHTHPVGQKKENEIGAFDMTGNVWEWCEDWKGLYTAEAQRDPAGPAEGMEKICKGGSWGRPLKRCRIAYRGDDNPELKYHTLGFRLALKLS